MYARSTTIRGANDMEAGLRLVREEVWPAMQTMPGCRGFSLLVERSAGRMIATSSWSSLEAMRSTDDAVAPMRQRVHELMGGELPWVEEWEIAVMRRTHHTGDGTWVRSTWTRVPVVAVENAVEFYKVALLRQLETLEGFCSASLMVDRNTGRGVSSVAFDSREAMAATRSMAEKVRAMSRQDAGVEVLEVAEFELALAHLHVPELV